MEEPPLATATSRLVADLVRDARRFIAAEIDLARGELAENGKHISSGLAALVGSAAFLLAGLAALAAAGGARGLA
jgi:hypothetical protein